MEEKELIEKIKAVFQENENVDTKTTHINIPVFCGHHGESAERVTKIIEEMPGVKIYQSTDGDITKPTSISLDKGEIDSTKPTQKDSQENDASQTIERIRRSPDE